MPSFWNRTLDAANHARDQLGDYLDLEEAYATARSSAIALVVASLAMSIDAAGVEFCVDSADGEMLACGVASICVTKLNEISDKNAGAAADASDR